MVEGFITQPRNIQWGFAAGDIVCPELFHEIDAVAETAKNSLGIQFENQILGLVYTKRAVLCWISDLNNGLR